MELLEMLNSGGVDPSFQKQLLQSLHEGCLSYLKRPGNKTNTLLAGNEIKQVACIKVIWTCLPVEERPPWLSDDAIESLGLQMRIRRAVRDYMIFEEDTNARYPFAKRYSELTSEEITGIVESCQGQIDTETLQCAIGDVIGRHPSLNEDGIWEDGGHD